MSGRKRIKLNENASEACLPDFGKMYDSILLASTGSDEHPFKALLRAHKEKRQPILQVVQATNDVFKPTAQKKKKPIEFYLDSVNHLYKKRDLDVLINPVTPFFAFQRWAPREVAIFEEAIVKFGKQFQFISELIATKNPKEVYDFYMEWKLTSHYKSFRAYMASLNKSNLEDLI